MDNKYTYCCDEVLSNLQQGYAKYDKNIVDLMKNKVILDVKDYEKMIRVDTQYAVEYKKLQEKVEAEYKAKYEEIERGYRRQIEDIERENRKRVEYLKKDLRDCEENNNRLRDKYTKLLQQTEKYRKTSWWKRHFSNEED